MKYVILKNGTVYHLIEHSSAGDRLACVSIPITEQDEQFKKPPERKGTHFCHNCDQLTDKPSE